MPYPGIFCRTRAILCRTRAYCAVPGSRAHPQALLAAHSLVASPLEHHHRHDHQRRHSELQRQPPQAGLQAGLLWGRSLFPLYGIAVQECLAATAAVLMAVASGGPEFSGCGLVPSCRTLCARIKQSALLPVLP